MWRTFTATTCKNIGRVSEAADRNLGFDSEYELEGSLNPTGVAPSLFIWAMMSVLDQSLQTFRETHRQMV